MNKDETIIADAIARFPVNFGLKAFPGEVFCISAASSFCSRYEDPSTLQLYTLRQQKDGSWRAFSRGTEAQLRDQLAVAVIPPKAAKLCLETPPCAHFSRESSS